MSLRDVKREPQDIPISLILPPELPARGQMDEQKLDELTANVARNGIIQRLNVVRSDDRYEVVAGHRRFIAATRAGLVTVPCDVYPTKEAALEAVKHAENRFREDMSPAEEAVYFAELLERDYGGDLEALAAGLGEKVSYVDGRLQLILGDQEVFQAIMDRKITIGVAHELNKVPAEDYRRYYLHLAMRDGATIATVSGWVSQWFALYGERTPTPAPAPSVSNPIVNQPTDIHYCYVCRNSDARFIPEQISVHTHCKLATLDPMLHAYHGNNGHSE